uniref:Transcription initiation factor TFIID subunit 10 n=1 Tax=Panagrolaimus sp. PS1159 TaxID=55785 RepID=A0AC35FTU9_9BILA
MHKAPALKPRDNAAEMLLRMKDYESVIPDAAAKYMMTRTGTAVDDDICYRMLAISAQKFASDILSDSITIARSRGLGQTNRATKETKYVLTQELLKEVFSEHGIRTFNS